jgi:aminopeptidase N
MENKGLNIFNDKLVLARPDTASDADYGAIEGVIAHEYFHNWTGDRVTCRDWFQLCLKEGLTVFRDQEFTADMRSGPVKHPRRARSRTAVPSRTRALAHPVRPRLLYRDQQLLYGDVTKGAELATCCRPCSAGGISQRPTYFERHDGAAATVEDFVAAMADSSDGPLPPCLVQLPARLSSPARADYDAQSRVGHTAVNQVVPPTPGSAEPMPIRSA